MKTLSLIAAATLATLLAPAANAQQAITIGPKHRYRFDNASGTLATGTQINDSIGTAHAFVRGTGASANGTGVRITGGSSATAAYIDLPNATVSGSAEMYPGFSEATYEVWVTVNSNQNWSRILDFGNNAIDDVTAPGGTFNGADYLMVSANIGTANNIRFERGGQYLTGGAQQDITGATTLGTRMHLVATYDTTSSAWKLYKNGTQIASIATLLGPSTIDDLNVWLGRSNWAGDNNADATYDEFRSYDYALSAQQVLANYQAGPEVVLSDSTNQAPAFTSNPFTKPAGTLGVAYSGSIASDATDPNAGDTLTFSKTSGPAWLSVASNGALTGTPPNGTSGTNAFVVRVTDQANLFTEATLNITVGGTLPSGWTAAGIGGPGIPGGASESSGTYTVSGSGADISGTVDSFQFVSKTLTGDGEIRARVTSQSNTNASAKAGVMLRDGSGGGSINAFVAVTPSNGFTFQSRSAVAGATTTVAGPATNAAPNNWVRLVRSGTLLTSYVSANGTTWTQVGTATLTMSSSVSAGLAVTSHNNSVLGTATFDNVVVTPFPSPWVSADIGTTGLQGSAEYYPSAFTVKGAGTFGGTSDAFRYVYQTLTNNGTVIARVSTLQNTGANARVGIMMRDTLAANSAMAALTVTGTGDWRWQRRTLAGGSVSTTNSSTGTAPNIWVRLARSGSTITASRSTNGTTWTTISSSTVVMSTTCYVGIAVASGSTTTLNTSVIDNVSVTPTSPLLQPSQDLDSDGLADSWESLYYTPAQYSPSDDPDGDGQTNADEYAAGTSPMSGTDATRLRILTASPAVFQFNGKAGRSYALERMVTTSGSEWTQVQTTGTFAVDGTQQITDPSPPAGRGIYRLQINLIGSP
ncbi:LamG-like jellyroll fold domain-containing protein [Luteolibacter soli]|uniref:LamG-like jellyroll fold domain-containing protein n=1 Tax=Luteolibacter soli TaxID=3135280 RepID=A0ABU9AUI0_9BACT